MKYLATMFVAISALIAVPFAAAADSHGIHVENAWTRATAPAAPAGAGFMVISNKGTEDDRLVSASTPVAEHVEIHVTEVEGNVMRMRKLADGLAVPAGQSVELKPGSYHLMLMGLAKQITEEEQVPVTLTFEKAGEIETSLHAMKAGARGHEGHGAYGAHDHHGESGHHGEHGHH